MILPFKTILLKINKHNNRNKVLFYIKHYCQNYISCTFLNILLSTRNSVNQLN